MDGLLYGVELLMCFCLVSCTSDCVSQTNCVSCTAFKCAWCPVEIACHGREWTDVNSCQTREAITDTAFCFDKTLGAYNPNSAFINTLLSAVAYASNPESCINRILPNSGFELVEAVGRKCDQLTIFNYAECFAYTAVSDALKLIVVVFKGTDGGWKQLWDEIGTTSFRPHTPFLAGGNVHVYFNNVFNLFYTCVKASVRDLVNSTTDYNILVTGHSLGGALASLTAAALVHDGILESDKLSLYTLGMPRVGDTEYADIHDRLVGNNWRVVNYLDIVAHLPPCNLVLGKECADSSSHQHHSKEVFYKGTTMAVNSMFTVCETREDPNCSNSIIGQCWPHFHTCIGYHTEYFQIQVGSYCDSSKSGKRSTETRSRFWSELEGDKCKRMPFDRVKRAMSNSSTLYFSREILSMFLGLLYMFVYNF